MTGGSIPSRLGVEPADPPATLKHFERLDRLDALRGGPGGVHVDAHERADDPVVRQAGARREVAFLVRAEVLVRRACHGDHYRQFVWSQHRPVVTCHLVLAI